VLSLLILSTDQLHLKRDINLYGSSFAVSIVHSKNVD